MFRWPDSDFMNTGLGLILMPNRLESGCGQTRLKGLTDSFAAPHETPNHLIDGIPIEALRTLIYNHQPVWDFDGLKHEFVVPLRKHVITWPRQIVIKNDLHIPCTIFWSLYAGN